MSSEWPYVTVIVPAFNMHAVLSECLQGLSAQTYPSNRYEIIVVDNGSTPDLKATVAAFPGVSYLAESKPSSYAARNAGVEHACGEVLAFTDADCIPAPDWIERGVEWLSDTPGCGLVGGHIQFTFKRGRRPTVLEFCDYICHGGFPQQHFVEADHFAATANAFTTRAVVEAVGPFNATFKSSGDLDFGHRVTAAGYALVYAPNTVVSHPARATLLQLIRKARRLQGGCRDFLRSRKLNGASVERFTSLKRRLIPGFVFVMREDYFKVQACQNLKGEPLRISGLTMLGTVFVVWLLRFIRFLERIRLAWGAPSFRG